MFSWFRKRPKFYPRRITLEQLEERIVLDAAAAAQPDVNQVEAGPEASHEPAPEASPAGSASADQPGGTQDDSPDAQVLGSDPAEVVVSHADAQSVASAGQDADDTSHDVRVLLISSEVSGADQLAAAAGENVITILYDASEGTPAGILSSIGEALGEEAASSIGLAVHDAGVGGFKLLEGYTVSTETPAGGGELQDFWAGLGGFLTDDGRIDILACDVTETATGGLLVSRIENLSAHTVAASDDLTGNPLYGGDWILERGNVDASPIYFDSEAITNFEGVLDSANQQPILSGDVTLSPIGEDSLTSGELVSDLLAGNFSDVGGTLGGIVVVGNDADPSTEGSWQFSSDNGET